MWISLKHRPGSLTELAVPLEEADRGALREHVTSVQIRRVLLMCINVQGLRPS